MKLGVQSAHCAERINLLPLLRFELRFLDHSARSLVTILTELSRLPIYTDSAQNDAEKISDKTRLVETLT
jgi:hypothetical protein